MLPRGTLFLAIILGSVLMVAWHRTRHLLEVGPVGFGTTVFACTSRAYTKLVNKYSKSGRQFANASAVLEYFAPSGGGFLNFDMPTDKRDVHNYTEYYDILLQPYVQMQKVVVLEVGVKSGGSLMLWRELFGRDSMIFGIDIDPSVPVFEQDPHMKVLAGVDTTDWNMSRKLFHGFVFDIIVDDGDHRALSQLRTMRGLWQFLSPRGIYIMEDVNNDCSVMRQAWPFMNVKNASVWIEGDKLLAHPASPTMQGVEKLRDHLGMGAQLSVHADRSGIERLMIFRPAASIAPNLEPTICTIGGPGSSCEMVMADTCGRRPRISSSVGGPTRS